MPVRCVSAGNASWTSPNLLFGDTSLCLPVKSRSACFRQPLAQPNNTGKMLEKNVIAVGSIETMVAAGPACDQTDGAEFAQFILDRVKRKSAHVS